METKPNLIANFGLCDSFCAGLIGRFALSLAQSSELKQQGWPFLFAMIPGPRRAGEEWETRTVFQGVSSPSFLRLHLATNSARLEPPGSVERQPW